MQEIVRRFASPPPGVVLDVGGGPGRYSCWLAKLGYEVHLIDPVPKHLQQALEASASQPSHPLASVSEGDARRLNRSNQSMDILLLMGPLYHLPDRGERMAALRESRRVLKADGVLIATAVNRFAFLMAGLMDGYIDEQAFMSMLHHNLSNGRYEPDLYSPRYFTTSFFHRPEELEVEVAEAGLHQKGLFSVQGPGEYAVDLEARMSDPARRRQLLDLVRLVEEERTLMGMASHLVIVAEK
jgi:ubiquinone/menaquinone biosynthesis C-methylase UbiE